MKKLLEALSAKERAETLLSNLERLKTEGTLEDDEYAHLKLEYSNALAQATVQVDQIHEELDVQVVVKKRDIETYKQQLKNLETRLKVGELDAAQHLKAARKTQRTMTKLEEQVAQMETLRGASNSAELGGTARLSGPDGAWSAGHSGLSRTRVVQLFSSSAGDGSVIDLVRSFEEAISPRSKLVAPIAGFFLFVSIFLRWQAFGDSYFRVSVSGSSSSGLVAMTVLAFLFSTLALGLAHPKVRGGIQLLMGILAIIVAVAVVFGGPSFSTQGYSLGVTLREGFYLYMLAAVAVITGGLLSLRRA